ncbi:hypothetical protein ACJIZ3_019660 [Penstemon smallii]|uniref:AB hydrolase-1 domain-containing protein n=1 Tax=Penstemon smallii TaxID=265156 RepID=A0ABD3T2H1_9LAMI
MVITQSNFQPAIHFAASTLRRRGHRLHFLQNRILLPRATVFRRLTVEISNVRAFSTNRPQAEISAVVEKPPICTADELHYVSLNNSDWRLALWRYKPLPQAPPRNHPLLLLSGVGTNAIGYDLSPGSSFARYMCGQGFDTWILEVRGAGLSMQGTDCKDVEKSAHAISDQMEAAVKNVTNGSVPAEQQSTMAECNGERPEVAGLSMQSSDCKDVEKSAPAVYEQMESTVDNVTNGSVLAEQRSTMADSNGERPERAGLSTQGSDCKDVEKTAHTISEKMESVLDNVTNGSLPAEQQSNMSESVRESPEEALVKKEQTEIATPWDESRMVTELTETFTRLSERLSGFLSESQSKIMSVKLFDQISKLLEDSFIFGRFSEVRGKLLSLLNTRQNSSVGGQIKDLSQKLVDIIDEGQRSVTPQFFDLQERLITTIEDFQKQLDLIVKYDWDFDHYLEEDVPIAMEYIRDQTRPKDGRILAIGHSMGGILLYAMLSRYSLEGKDPGLAAVVTLASSLDYTSSNSTLKLLLPLADPAQALNVPVVPLGALLAAAYPLSSRPPYVLSWLNDLISAEDMMHPELFKKLVLNNFCTIPAKLLLQLTTSFKEGGLRDRSGKLFYQDHLHKSNVPVLAVAGDRDLICPPEAVYETVKHIPEHLVTYKVFGEPDGPHYAHYDLVGGRMAVDQLYPCIVQFLSSHDTVH